MLDFTLPTPQLASRIWSLYSQDPYVCAHARRYAFTLKLLQPHIKPGMRLLDIGYTKFTQFLHQMTGCPVDSMSNWAEAHHPEGHHYSFDLNDAVFPDRWRSDVPKYDLIVFAEVIEHLHISAYDSINYLKTLLVPGGKLLIQTPNAVAWSKRLRMLAGVHPYQFIEQGNTGNSHIREYTMRELREVLEASGFRILHEGMYNYFDQRNEEGAPLARQAKTAVVRAINALSPPSMRRGMTLIAQTGS